MAKSELEQYKETVSARLSQLSPFLQNYALGDFSESIEIPEEEDEFTELLVGLSLMADDIKELVQEKESTIAERKQAEEALRESERRLSTTLRSIGDAVIATDAQGLVTLMNPVAENLTGWDEAEALSKPLEEVFHIINEQTGEQAENPVARVLREGVVVGLANHTLLIAKDGPKRPIADSGAPMRDEEGNIIGTVMVFRDITERRQAEKKLKEYSKRLEEMVEERTAELRESEEKLRAQYKGIPIPTGTWQRVGEGFVLVDYNDALEEVTQGGIANFVGMKARDLYQDRPIIVEGLSQCFAEKAAIEQEMFYQYKSTGEGRYLAVRYAFVPPDLVLVHTEDITARKRAQETLERRVTELRALNTMAAIVNESLDVDELLNRAMDEALRLVGVEAAAMLLLDGPSTGPSTGSGQRSGQGKAGELVMAAHRGISDEFARVFSRIKLGEGLSGQVAQTGEPVVMGDLSEYPDALKAYLEKERIQSAAFVPLIGSTGVMGTMNLGTANPDYFDAAGLELLMALGGQIAIGVEKLRLYAETRAQAEELRKHRDHLEERVKERTAELQRTNEELEAQIAERVRAEQMLAESERKYRALVDHAPVGVIQTSASTGEILFVNDAALRIFEFDSKEEFLAQRSPTRWKHPKERERFVQLLREHGEVRGFEAEALTKTDQTKTVVIASKADEDTLLSTVLDITERKRAEEKLRESEERFASFMHHLPAAVYLKDADGRILFLNEYFEKLFQRRVDECLGKTDLDLFPADVAKQLREADQQILSEGKPVQSVEKIPQDDGLHTYIAYKFPLLKEGAPTLLGGISIDITKQVRAEESLRIRDQAITTSITPFAVSDLEGHLTYVNPAFLKLWGYEEEAEVLGEPATDFWLREEDVAEIIAALQKEGFWRGEMLAKRKDGTTFMADISASMVVDATGAPICLASSFVDITDRVQAQEALAQRVEELERFNRLAVGRELRMIELKRQINQLSEQLGKEPPYDVSFAEEG